MNMNLHFLEQAIALAKDHKLPFKNITRLAGYCAEFIDMQRPDATDISITTLTRNKVYRAILEGYMQERLNDTAPYEIRQLKIANSNLRHDLKRLQSYAMTLEAKQANQIIEQSKTLAVPIDLEKSHLVKTIDLLLERFSDHVVIDAETENLICPYLKSKDRIVVSAIWAKYYLKLKSKS